MSIKLSNREIEIVNEVIERNKITLKFKKVESIQEIINLKKVEIWLLIDSLTDLIRYDKTKDDIDALGKEADEIISKLLQFLTMRGEM